MYNLKFDKNYVIEFSLSEKQSIVSRCTLEEQEIEDILGTLGWELIEIDTLYQLGDKERAALIKLLPHRIGEIEDEFLIRRSIWTDSLSYQIHTNRELYLMLKDMKPLSVFVDNCLGSPGEIPEDIFEPYVKQGTFCLKQFVINSIVNGQDLSTRYVLYSIPDEEWRINEYMKNVKQVDLLGSTSETEKREGYLLGYTEEQNSEYLKAQAEHEKKASTRMSAYLSLKTVFTANTNKLVEKQ
ncbi:MAG: hypothetical protein GY820_08520 [Gammaproteobacteria bacterium]|nr:hypothetical protein [Gammaproteobacteria bacterium]